MTTKTQNTNEIDLIELFAKMANAISKTFKSLVKLIYQLFLGILKGFKFSARFTLQNGLIILGFTVSGLIVGTVLNLKSTPYFKTSAVVQSNTIPNAHLMDYINRLNTLSTNSDSIGLSEQLNISIPHAANIKNIQAFWLIDNNKDGIADKVDYNNEFIPDTVSNSIRISNRFHIQLLTYNSNTINEIQKGLENYIDNYPRIKQIAEVKQRNLKYEIRRINDEIQILDSLRKYEYFVKDKEIMRSKPNVIKINDMLFSTNTEEEKPTRLLHNDIIALSKENIHNIHQLELETEPYIFLSKFLKVNNPVDIEKETGTRKRITILMILTSIVLIVFVRYRKNIMNYINS
jgi:hypothetical protein